MRNTCRKGSSPNKESSILRKTGRKGSSPHKESTVFEEKGSSPYKESAHLWKQVGRGVIHVVYRPFKKKQKLIYIINYQNQQAKSEYLFEIKVYFPSKLNDFRLHFCFCIFLITRPSNLKYTLEYVETRIPGNTCQFS